MEFFVDKLSDGEFYINLENKMWFDHQVAKLLNLSLKEYQDILLKYNGFNTTNGTEIFFKTYEDCERALNSKELLPKIIMLKLLGE